MCFEESKHQVIELWINPFIGTIIIVSKGIQSLHLSQKCLTLLVARNWFYLGSYLIFKSCSKQSPQVKSYYGTTFT